MYNGHGHGRRKDFFQGGPLGVFPKFFQGEPKVVKFVFPLEIKNKPFFAEIFKIQRGLAPPRPLSDAHENGCFLGRDAGTNFA